MLTPAPPPPSRSSPWKPVRDSNYQVPPRPTDLETLGGGVSNLCFNKLAWGFWGTHCLSPIKLLLWSHGGDTYVNTSWGLVAQWTTGCWGRLLALPLAAQAREEKRDQHLNPGDSWLYREGPPRFPPSLSHTAGCEEGKEPCSVGMQSLPSGTSGSCYRS